MTSSSAQTPLRSEPPTRFALRGFLAPFRCASSSTQSLCCAGSFHGWALRGLLGQVFVGFVRAGLRSSEQTSHLSRVVADCASLAYTQSVKARSLHRSSFPHKASLCGGPIPLRCALRGFFAPLYCSSSSPQSCALRGFARVRLRREFFGRGFAGGYLGASRGVFREGLRGRLFRLASWGVAWAGLRRNHLRGFN